MRVLLGLTLKFIWNHIVVSNSGQLTPRRMVGGPLWEENGFCKSAQGLRRYSNVLKSGFGLMYYWWLSIELMANLQTAEWVGPNIIITFMKTNDLYSGSALKVKTRNHASAYFWPPLCIY